jgi:hypothetical protein
VAVRVASAAATATAAGPPVGSMIGASAVAATAIGVVAAAAGRSAVGDASRLLLSRYGDPPALER